MMNLEQLIYESKRLSPIERLKLITAVSQSLYQLETAETSQSNKAVQDVSQLRAPFWPVEESADEMIQYIYQQRKEDRDKDI